MEQKIGRPQLHTPRLSTSRHRRRFHAFSISGPFLDLRVAADDLGHIGVLFLFDEGGIVEALVIDFDFILRFGCPARFLLALRFRMFLGDELSLLGFSHNRLDLAHRGAPAIADEVIEWPFGGMSESVSLDRLGLTIPESSLSRADEVIE
jgi:hypothetical protein